MNKASRKRFGEDAYSLVMNHIWGCPSAHVLLFSLLLRFPLIRFISHSGPLFYDLVMLLGSSDSITFMYSSCVYSLYTATTALYPCFFIPFLAVIYVNFTFMAIFCMSCIKIKYSSQCWLIGYHISSLGNSSRGA